MLPDSIGVLPENRDLELANLFSPLVFVFRQLLRKQCPDTCFDFLRMLLCTYDDMQSRLDTLYDEIEAIEDKISELQTRIENIMQRKISCDQVYQFLLYFDKLYEKFTDAEKKEFLNSFIERVTIFPEALPSGRILRGIKFRFPVFFDGQEVQEIGWDTDSTVESVVLMSRA